MKRITDTVRLDWLLGSKGDFYDGGFHRIKKFLDFYYSQKNKHDDMRRAIDAMMARSKPKS